MPDTESLQTVMDGMPAGLTILLAAGVAVGMVLWLLGSRLVKPACVVSGLIGGAVAGLFAAGTLGESYLIALVIGGGLIGGVLGMVLFRIWAAVLSAAVLAAVMPVVSLVWNGVAPPILQSEEASQIESSDDPAPQIEDGADQPMLNLSEINTGQAFAQASPAGPSDADETEAVDNADTPDRADQARDAAVGLFKRLLDGAKGVSQEAVAEAKAWWDGLSPGWRQTAMFGAGAGALIGLILGLIIPTLATAIASSAAGSLMLFYCGRELAIAQLGEAPSWLPQTARAELLTVGLITLAGLVVQWTMRKRKTDKQ